MEKFPIPEILQCNHFVAESSSEDSRYVRDYEFDFYLEDERDIYIDEQHYKASKGCMVFRRPGQFVRGIGNYNIYLLTVDFSRSSELTPGRYIRGDNTPQQEICNIDVLNDIPSVFFPAHQEDIIALYKAMCRCSYPNVIDRKLQDALVTEFLFLVISDAYKYLREASQKGNMKKTYVEMACDYINKNYSGELSVGGIAEHLSLNKNYLIKLFKKEISITPNQYIMQTRLFYAKLMLIQTDTPIKSIAAACGFITSSYFIKCFKEKHGISPLIYRNRYLAGKKESAKAR